MWAVEGVVLNFKRVGSQLFSYLFSNTTTRSYMQMQEEGLASKFFQPEGTEGQWPDGGRELTKEGKKPTRLNGQLVGIEEGQPHTPPDGTKRRNRGKERKKKSVGRDRQGDKSQTRIEGSFSRRIDVEEKRKRKSKKKKKKK